MNAPNDKEAGLQVGLKHRASFRVEERRLVPNAAPDWPGFADIPPVLATALMIGFMEQTCVEAIRPFLAPGRHSLGVTVDVAHSAPTPAGMVVTAEVELLAIEGRRLTFAVRASDDAGLIGEGRHERALIDLARFQSAVEKRRAAL